MIFQLWVIIVCAYDSLLSLCSVSILVGLTGLGIVVVEFLGLILFYTLSYLESLKRNKWPMFLHPSSASPVWVKGGWS